MDLPDVCYPSTEHARATEALTGFFCSQPPVQAVLLTNSTARGKATRDSCLDIAILISPQLPPAERTLLEEAWNGFYARDPACQAVQAVGRYSHIDLEFIDGCFAPGVHHYTSGPDAFELEIGNFLVYSRILWQTGTRLAELKHAWLPYYPEDLRRTRLAEKRHFCLNNLNHIPLYVARGLYFQSLGRLWHAFQEFMQALFIQRRTYPIAYDKWIKEQVVDILGLPELYPQLISLFEIPQFESPILAEKAKNLLHLLDTYIPESEAKG